MEEAEHRFLYWAGSDRISWQKLKPLSRWNDRLRVDIETEISTGDRKRRDISFPTVINVRGCKLINAHGFRIRTA